MAVTGLIGSNLVDELLLMDQKVIGLDNLSTAHRRNLGQVRAAVGPERWGQFTVGRGLAITMPWYIRSRSHGGG